jgi:hypothetical protein
MKLVKQYVLFLAGDKSTSNTGAAAVAADRSTPYKICFQFMSRGFCSRTTCSSNHICEDVVPYLQAMELMASKSPDNHFKIVSVLGDMLTVASPLHKQFATHTDNDVNDFTSKLLKTIVQVCGTPILLDNTQGWHSVILQSDEIVAPTVI